MSFRNLSIFYVRLSWEESAMRQGMGLVSSAEMAGDGGVGWSPIGAL